jgi:hypothetical protein
VRGGRDSRRGRAARRDNIGLLRGRRRLWRRAARPTPRPLSATDERCCFSRDRVGREGCRPSASAVRARRLDSLRRAVLAARARSRRFPRIEGRHPIAGRDRPRPLALSPARARAPPQPRHLAALAQRALDRQALDSPRLRIRWRSRPSPSPVVVSRAMATTGTTTPTTQ